MIGSGRKFLRIFAITVVATVALLAAVTESLDPFGENGGAPFPGHARFAYRVLAAPVV